MARPPNAHRAIRSAKADARVQATFPALHAAALSWRDHGDAAQLAEALALLEQDTQVMGPTPLEDGMTRSEKVEALAARLVTAGQLQRRVRETLGVIEAQVGNLHAELAATLAQGDSIAEYQRQFIRRLEAEGIGQPDLHPASGELAKVVATAVRTYRTTKGNNGRRGSDDYPINAWHELPRTFAGIQLEDVTPDDVIDSTPCPLPPSPNSAHYTNGKVPLEPKATRRETLVAWSPRIKAWCEKHSVRLTSMQVAAWAMLLAHRLANDASDLKNLNGLEMVSPWDPNGVVRFVVLPPPAEQDA